MSPRAAVRLSALLALACCFVLAACEEPRPRTFIEFTEDALARDGTLARCNQDREGTANDLECINARRAAAAVAAREDAARREQLELESQRKREALRAQIAAQQEAERRAEQAALAAAEQRYETRWTETPAEQPYSVRSGVGWLAPWVETPVHGAVHGVHAAPASQSAAAAHAPVPASDELSFVELPASLRKPAPPEPVLEEIVLPQRLPYPAQ